MNGPRNGGRLLTALGLGLLLCAAGRAVVVGARAPVTHTVMMDGTAFAPQVLSVRAGDTVVWINKDPFPHTATSESGRFDSRTIDEGKSWKYKTARRGDFAYICSFHPTMKGTLRVE